MRRKVKKVAKEAAKLYVKKRAAKNRPQSSRKLYTDKEKEALQELYKQRNKLKRHISKITANTTVTMKDIRRYIPKDIAQQLFYKDYFSSENTDNYNTKDFREWLSENGDTDELDEIIQNVEALAPDILTEQDPDLDLYRNDLAKVNKQIDDIRTKAKNRKELERLKQKAHDIQAKQDLEKAEALIDRIDEGESFINALKDGEKTTINYLKRRTASAIIDKLDLSDMDPTEASKLKGTLYMTLAYNPKEGVREYIRSSVVDKVTQQYGNDAGDLAGSLINLATGGKGEIRFAGLSLFKGVINRTQLNPSVMSERAQELIAAGESTEEKENIKRLGRDIVVDIASDIIKAGGNVYAAIPMALKDVLLDTGRAAIRKRSK